MWTSAPQFPDPSHLRPTSCWPAMTAPHLFRQGLFILIESPLGGGGGGGGGPLKLAGARLPATASLGPQNLYLFASWSPNGASADSCAAPCSLRPLVPRRLSRTPPAFRNFQLGNRCSYLVSVQPPSPDLVTPLTAKPSRAALGRWTLRRGSTPTHFPL